MISSVGKEKKQIIMQKIEMFKYYFLCVLNFCGDYSVANQQQLVLLWNYRRVLLVWMVWTLFYDFYTMIAVIYAVDRSSQNLHSSSSSSSYYGLLERKQRHTASLAQHMHSTA